MSDRIVKDQEKIKIDETKLVCGECKDILTDPYILPCLHSLCKHCLVSIYGNNTSCGVITCPECEEDIDKPKEGIEGFQKNHFLKGLLSVHITKTADTIRCKICELQHKDTFATHKCLNCADFLCDDCGKAHTFTRMTFEHHVQPLSELKDGLRDREMRDKQMIPCTLHEGEAIKYYCETCKEPICRECQLEFHVGHTCAQVSESQASRRQALSNMIFNVDQKLSALKSVEEGIDATYVDIEKREKDLIEGVERTVKKLVDQIEREKTDLLKSLKRTMDDQRDACAAKREQISRVHEIMSGNLDFSNDIVKNGKDEEVLFLETVIRRRLLQIHAKNITSLTMKWNPPDVRFRNVFLGVDRIGLFELTLSRDFHRLPGPPLKFGARHVGGFHLVRRINITVPREDQFECRPTGLACLYKEHLVIGDQENRKIKIFTRLGNYVETVANFKPSGIAACGDVIGATDNMSLNLYTNNRSIKKKISLESTGSTYPITAMTDQYLVVVNNKVASFQLYDLRGELCHDITPPKGSKIRNPVFVTANSKGQIIVSDWLSNCVIIMDQQGETVKEYKLKAKVGKTGGWLPGSLCCDQFDNIFISDYSRSRIIVLNPMGEFMFEYPTRMDLLDRPRCMACDGNGCLIVAGKGGYLNVYECQYV